MDRDLPDHGLQASCCFERALWGIGLDLVAGIDEVGRGCLAGPVVAAAVIMPRDPLLPGVTDSKILSPGRRRILEKRIRALAVAVSVAQVEPGEIDRINIGRASLMAMAMAADGLDPRPQALLIDGNQFIPHTLPQKTVIRGDSRCFSIAAASIVAKVFRDALMDVYHHQYPQYNFLRHKGYGTAEHRKALDLHGACAIHRKTFKGVREILSG